MLISWRSIVGLAAVKASFRWPMPGIWCPVVASMVSSSGKPTSSTLTVPEGGADAAADAPTVAGGGVAAVAGADPAGAPLLQAEATTATTAARVPIVRRVDIPFLLGGSQR